MSTKHMSAALLALVLAVTATAAQAAPHRWNGAAQSGAGYQADDAPWSFACIKDHGPQRCSDLNQ